MTMYIEADINISCRCGRPGDVAYLMPQNLLEAVAVVLDWMGIDDPDGCFTLEPRDHSLLPMPTFLSLPSGGHRATTVPMMGKKKKKLQEYGKKKKKKKKKTKRRRKKRSCRGKG